MPDMNELIRRAAGHGRSPVKPAADSPLSLGERQFGDIDAGSTGTFAPAPRTMNDLILGALVHNHLDDV